MRNDKSQQPLHSIQVAARRSGLKPDVIRAWERRYQAIVPVRTPTGRRLYADPDIERLEVLAALTRSGHRIGDVAHHPLDLLRSMIRQQLPPTAPTLTAESSVLPECLAAIAELDGHRLRSILEHALVSHAPEVFTDEIVVPLLRKIGLIWWQGQSNPGHEHLATAIVRSALMDIVTTRPGIRRDASIIVTTPAGQRHEIGALLVATTASIEGWTVHYLGADLPADAIGQAVGQTRPDVLALSIIHPPDDPGLGDELRRIRARTPRATAILVGGAAAGAYGEPLEEIGAMVLPDLATLRQLLRTERPGRSALLGQG